MVQSYLVCVYTLSKKVQSYLVCVYTLSEKIAHVQSTVYLHLRQICVYLHFTGMHKVS